MARYDEPQAPKDAWARRLYHEHGLEEAPTMQAIEAVATPLLSDMSTALTGAEMVLGRRIDGKERDIAMIYANPMLDAKSKFAMLLMQRATEG